MTVKWIPPEETADTPRASKHFGVPLAISLETAKKVFNPTPTPPTLYRFVFLVSQRLVILRRFVVRFSFFS